MRQRVMTAMTSSMPRAFRRFGRDRRGVSAVEFAFIAPVMIGLYLGCVEISDGVAADRKVSLVSAALANLTASCSSSNANAGSCANNIISTTEMNNILDASSAIIAPYAAGNLKMTVSCLSVDLNKNVTVKWSETRNGTKRTNFTFDSSNSALATASSYPILLIYSEVSYAYTPIVGYTITGTLTLSDHMFMAPRTQAPSYPDANPNHTCS
jgi:Flp pilus assembly protein TadG